MLRFPRRSCAAGATSVLALFALSACNMVTKVGNTCASGECTAAASCDQSKQQLSETCESPRTRTCNGAVVPPDQVACDDCNATLERLKIHSNVASCACVYCAAQVRACFASSAAGERNGDPARDIRCQGVVECGWSRGCIGSDCYCGKGVDRSTCLQQANDPDAGARGPCADVIEAAVGCADAELRGNCVFADQLKSGSLLERATEVAKCVTGDPLVQGEVIEPKCPYDQVKQLTGP